MLIQLLMLLELALHTKVSSIVAFERLSPRLNHLAAMTSLLQIPQATATATSTSIAAATATATASAAGAGAGAGAVIVV
jgi:hypothetical protein